MSRSATMVNETRVILLGPLPHVSPKIREYWATPVATGTDALVVETTNFTDKTPYRGSSEELKLTERSSPSVERRSGR